METIMTFISNKRSIRTQVRAQGGSLRIAAYVDRGEEESKSCKFFFPKADMTAEQNHEAAAKLLLRELQLEGMRFDLTGAWIEKGKSMVWIVTDEEKLAE